MKPNQSREGHLRELIGSACEMIESFGHHSALFPKDSQDHTNDTYVLLEDATQMYCRVVSAGGEVPSRSCWSPRLVDDLFSNPMDYEKTLDEIARDDCPGIPRVAASRLT